MIAAQRHEPSLSFARRTRKDGLVVKVAGSLGVYQATQLHEQLSSGLTATHNLVLDLGGVTACDLTALQLLISAWRSGAAAGPFMRIAEASEAVLEAIAAAGLSADDVLGAMAREGQER